MAIRRNNKIETITYSVSGGYMVDVVIEHDKRFADGEIRTEAGAWLYRKNGGTKRFLFGEFIDRENTLKDFIDTVKWDVEECPTTMMNFELDEEIEEEATERAFDEGRFDHIRELNKQIYG